ncbi:hypothetical protein GCM10009799_50250 [Nocardiopsis rhodophaea]|uniref:Integral membrane protein n=1 Tax=Nocardiopsis rhodophaea TaxID=280238 RepID=A0ABN2TR47_9ACTN
MSSRPITITLAAALQALIGLAVAIEGCYVLVGTLLGRAFDATQALPLAVFALLAAAALGYVAWGLYRLNDWARTPVVVTQIFVLVIAYYMWTSQQYAISAALAVVAVAALALVLSPPTTATLFPDNESWQNKRGRQ